MKAALIGTGHIARQHLGCLRALPGVELAAVCDRSPAAAELAAERFGARQWFTDHREMLASVRPDVVHVTTPPHVHFALGMDALEAGSHVVVEKPAAASSAELEQLLERARSARRHVVESHNYLFNSPVRRLRELCSSGELGDVVHVEITLALDITADGNPFVDRNVAHPVLAFPGGAIADFLPHLASLTYAFIGPHRTSHSVWEKRDPSTPLPSDEFRALVEGERGTASLCFTSHGRPEAFVVRVTGTRLRATAGLFEPRLVVERLHAVPRPLIPVVNGLAEGREAVRAAVGGLTGKFRGGPGSYGGLWTLIEETYAALAAGNEPPVSAAQVQAVHALIDDLTRDAPVAA